MMVIHDIDQNAEKMRLQANLEEEYFNKAQYVINHLDQLDSISEDTLIAVFNFFLDYDINQTDNSKEKIFHSSQDSWKNIDNANFIDLVEEFYYKRQIYDDFVKNDMRFKGPITPEDQYQMMLNLPNYDLWSNVKTILKQQLNDEKVQLYLIYSPYRVRYYQTLASEWQRLFWV